jgi:hypothetical protein
MTKPPVSPSLLLSYVHLSVVPDFKAAYECVSSFLANECVPSFLAKNKRRKLDSIVFWFVILICNDDASLLLTLGA